MTSEPWLRETCSLGSEELNPFPLLRGRLVEKPFILLDCVETRVGLLLVPTRTSGCVLNKLGPLIKSSAISRVGGR
jgi:hypothetical protein